MSGVLQRETRQVTELFLEYPCGQSPEYVIKGPTKYISLISDPVDEELTFVHPDDVKLYNEWDSRAFELQVANHELLGHGSGKLFEEYPDGTKNFDPEKVSKNPIQHYDAFLKKPAGHQSSNWAKNVRCAIIYHQIFSFFAVLHGTSRVKPLAQFSERYHPQWRNAVQRPLHSIVGRRFMFQHTS